MICELEIFVAPCYRLLNCLALAAHVDTCFTYQLVRPDVSQLLWEFHSPNIFDETAGVYQCRYSNSALLCLVTTYPEFNSLSTYWGTRWRSWLRHCATRRQFAGSIPDGAIEIFH